MESQLGGLGGLRAKPSLALLLCHGAIFSNEKRPAVDLIGRMMMMMMMKMNFRFTRFANTREVTTTKPSAEIVCRVKNLNFTMAHICQT